MTVVNYFPPFVVGEKYNKVDRNTEYKHIQLFLIFLKLLHCDNISVYSYLQYMQLHVAYCINMHKQ